jgi:hypothetical protein
MSLLSYRSLCTLGGFWLARKDICPPMAAKGASQIVMVGFPYENQSLPTAIFTEYRPSCPLLFENGGFLQRLQHRHPWSVSVRQPHWVLSNHPFTIVDNVTISRLTHFSFDAVLRRRTYCPHFHFVSSLRFDFGVRHQATLLGAPSLSVWDLCICGVGQLWRRPLVRPPLCPLRIPNPFSATATVMSIMTTAPFAGQADVSLGVAYISIIVIFFMVRLPVLTGINVRSSCRFSPFVHCR